MSGIIIQLTCPDQKGIIAQFTQLLFENNVNILSLEQHVEPDEKLFFMRAHADLENTTIATENLSKSLDGLEDRLNGSLTLYDFNRPLNMAILCTKEQVHLIDLLMKKFSGELKCNIPIVISNHENLKYCVEQYGIPYHYLPISGNNKADQEREIAHLLDQHDVDLIVLARYMQILSPSFVNKYRGKIINIHHAFLPAFKGKKPYHKAWHRGVKMIGATAHYVTEELDEGPIIEQDVESITHHYSVSGMIQAGRDIERRVLSSAVKAHLEYRILLHGKRTLIFHS